MARRDEAQTVQVGLRVKEPLRLLLEESARERGISMNAEIVRRLERTFEPPEHKIDVDKLRSELHLVLMSLAELFVTAKEKEISNWAMGIFLDASAALACTYDPSDEKWGRIQQRLEAMAVRGRELKEQDR
jgi:hypothetical protein